MNVGRAQKIGIVVALVLVALGIVARTVITRALVSEELRKELEADGTALVRAARADAAVVIPALERRGILGAGAPRAEITYGQGSSLPFSLALDLGLIPHVLGGRVKIGWALDFGADGRVEGDAIAPLADPDRVGAWKARSDGVSLKVLGKVLGARPGMTLVGGKVAVDASGSGTDKGKAALRFSDASWMVTAPFRFTLTLPPTTAEFTYEKGILRLAKPLEVPTPAGPMTLAGAVKPGPVLALKATAPGGMIGRMGVAKLLRCKNMPTAASFDVTGEPDSPECKP